MSNARWQQIQHVYHAALERPASARADFLREACQDDSALLHEVQSLLDQPISAERFLESDDLEADVDTPSVHIGQRLGVYQIQALIGRGGMGEVYRALDTKLSRDVAIKILPSVFTSDRGRLVRFEREARVLASLNHPHIGAIYGFEEGGGVRALVLELVEGETLAEKIVRGRIPIKDALSIARQIADGLDAAHEKGVVHRDLKPANIAITPAGIVKVLDFGLAKLQFAADGADLSRGRMVTLDRTDEGLLTGTAAYMSPEQARGQALNKRTDIWAFGCVLYEMLTGKRAFPGDTVSDAIAAILEREPDWTRLPPPTPPAVRRVLERCLQKDPKRRLHDIADARIELGDATESGVVRDAAPRRTWFRHVVPWVAGAIVGSSVAGLIVWNLVRRTSADTVQPQQFSIALTPSSVMPPALSNGVRLALSPDGANLVYVADSTDADALPILYLRRLSEHDAKPLAGTEYATRPFFSPDGDWIGFTAIGRLMKVSTHGGDPVIIAKTDGIGTWLEGDRIIFTSRPQSGGPARLFSVSSAGGVPQALASRKDDLGYFGVWALPGGKAVLFDIGETVAVMSLDTGAIKVLADPGLFPRYVSSGHIVYLRRSSYMRATLMAMPFDAARLEPLGAAVPAVQDVNQDLFAVSQSGLLVYVGAPVNEEASLTWVDRLGHSAAVLEGKADYFEPRLSPEGRRLAIGIGGIGDIWIVDLQHGGKIPLTHNDRTGTLQSVATNPATAWTPDGKYVTMSRSLPTGEVQLVQVSVDGTRPSQTLYSLPNLLVQPGSWSASGELLAFHVSTPRGDRDLMVWNAAAHKAERFLATTFKEAAPRFSPDGHWIAYVSDASGRDEVYLRRYPDATDPLLASNSGGREPVWSRDARELFYRNGRRMMSVSVDLRSRTPVLGPPTELFEADYRRDHSTAGIADYDVAADGRFLMLRPVTSGVDASVVVNWGEELKRLAPAKQ